MEFGYCMCDIFGVNHIWLQSDAAFVYPRLDSTAWAWECYGLRDVCHVVHRVA